MSYIINKETLNEMLDDFGKEELIPILEAFKLDSEQQVNALLTVLSSDDLESLMELSHTIKGSSAMIGLENLSAICAELEAASKKKDLISAQQYGEKVPQIYQDTIRELQNYIDSV